MGQLENSIALKEARKPKQNSFALEHWKELIWALITILHLGFGLTRFLMTAEQGKDLCKGIKYPNLTAIGGMSNKIIPLVSWLPWVWVSYKAATVR